MIRLTTKFFILQLFKIIISFDSYNDLVKTITLVKKQSSISEAWYAFCYSLGIVLRQENMPFI